MPIDSRGKWKGEQSVSPALGTTAVLLLSLPLAPTLEHYEAGLFRLLGSGGIELCLQWQRFGEGEGEQREGLLE